MEQFSIVSLTAFSKGTINNFLPIGTKLRPNIQKNNCSGYTVIKSFGAQKEYF